MQPTLKRLASLAVTAGLLVGCATTPPPGDALQAAGWQTVPLPGKQVTRYRFDAQGGRQDAIRADADGSASMLRRITRVEPGQLGGLRFSWRVDELIAAADLTDRDTEDSPVRVVLAFEGDHGKLSARNSMLFDLAHAISGERPPYATLMYVWDNKAARETVLSGGRTDRIRKIVVETGTEHRGMWREYERRIGDDYRRAFGEEPGPLVAVGIMTDADNTRSRARAWYGDIELLPAGSAMPR